MKIFITGASGQLGRDVYEEAKKRGHVVTGTSYSAALEDEDIFKLDITDREATEKAIEEADPDAVIHCAAWTAVDAAELPENRESVLKVNAEGTGNVARAATKCGAKVIYISTDYVFNGQGERPWRTDDPTEPLNTYGYSKMLGEREVMQATKDYYIVRIAWLFGNAGRNFADTMLRLSDTHDELRVVNDQIGNPTYSPDLARILVDMAEREEYGIYHVTNEGEPVSWADYAKEIFKEAKKDTRVIPVTTEEYGISLARRPNNSRLDKSKLAQRGFEPLPDWRDALGRFLRNK